MANFNQAYRNFVEFQSGLENECVRIIQIHSDDLLDMIRSQLYSGLNGNDKPIRPTYETDPYFRTPEAGRWRNNSKGYARWKYFQTPPRGSAYLHPPRDFSTPNLIINGLFYDSISAVKIKDGVNILSQGINFGNDIEKKYGSTIFGIGNRSKEYFMSYIFKPLLKRYFSQYGM